MGDSESAATMTVDIPSQISSISNDQIVDGSEWVIKNILTNFSSLGLLCESLSGAGTVCPPTVVGLH